MQLTQPLLTQSVASSEPLNQALSVMVSFAELSTPLTEEQNRTLQVARQALLSSDKPHLLKVISYLRISCSVLRTYRQGMLSGSATLPKITFTGLMQSLYDYDPEWWKRCQVTVTGRLTSNDVVIEQVLQPIDALHQL